MKYDETDPNARKIYVLLRNLGAPLTGFTPSAGQLKLSLSGSSTVNGAGVWTEVGSGLYTYQCTQAETQTLSYIMLIIIASGVDTFCWIEDIGYRIPLNESNAAKRRIPIFLLGPSGVVTGAAVSSETTKSINGAAFSAPGGTFGESGNGGYYYQATAGEVGALGGIVLKTANAAVTYVYTQSILDATVAAPSTGTSGYFGAYFGVGEQAIPAAAIPPSPIAAPTSPANAIYVDHIEAALNRLCEYAKAKAP